MIAINSNFALFLICFHVSHCGRRIKDGIEVTTEKTYVVYLVKAPISARMYDSWLCGGALVTKDFVLTSAACVEDVNFLYVIAGYRKYITDSNIEYNDCTQKMKKKVIFTCVPYAYEFNFDVLEKWSYIDIALAKVESPYDFDDVRYEIICDYIPTTIPINYDPKYQRSGSDAVVFGWGHPKLWRKVGDKKNYNQQNMHYASVLVLDKDICKREYRDYPDMVPIIEKYMICSSSAGNINDDGEPIGNPPLLSGCGPGRHKRMGPEGVICEDDINEKQVANNQGFPMYDAQEGRRNMRSNISNDDETAVKKKTVFKRSAVFNRPVIFKRQGGSTSLDNTSDSNGICQNDHGGPLVTWIGSHEILIGIASVFKVTEDNECVGPYLYTSTYCNGAFINCVINHKFGSTVNSNNRSATRQALCDSPASVKGFDIVEKHISWKNHPAGPAENERHETRGRSGTVENPPEQGRFSSKKEHSFDFGLPDTKLTEKKEPTFSYKLPEIKEETPGNEGNDRFSAFKEHSFRHGLPENDRFPVKKKHALDRGLQENDRFTINKEDSITYVVPPVRDRFSEKKRHSFNFGLPENGRVQQQYVENKKDNQEPFMRPQSSLLYN